MAYFNYHAKAKDLIRTGHCIKAEILPKHNKISPALVLHFDNHAPMPIRLYRFEEYAKLLQEFNVTIKKHPLNQ